MKSQKPIPIRCTPCRRYLYKWKVKEALKDEVIRASHFKPYRGVPQPQSEDEIKCPYCKSSLISEIRRIYGLYKSKELIRCDVCHMPFDPSRLSEVVKHEHKGISTKREYLGKKIEGNNGEEKKA